MNNTSLTIRTERESLIPSVKEALRTKAAHGYIKRNSHAFTEWLSDVIKNGYTLAGVIAHDDFDLHLVVSQLRDEILFNMKYLTTGDVEQIIYLGCKGELDDKNFRMFSVRLFKSWTKLYFSTVRKEAKEELRKESKIENPVKNYSEEEVKERFCEWVNTCKSHGRVVENNEYTIFFMLWYSMLYDEIKERFPNNVRIEHYEKIVKRAPMELKKFYGKYVHKKAIARSAAMKTRKHFFKLYIEQCIIG